MADFGLKWTGRERTTHLEPLKTLFSRIFNLSLLVWLMLSTVVACGLTEPVVEVHTDKPVGAPATDPGNATPDKPVKDVEDSDDEDGDTDPDDGEGDEKAGALAFAENIAPILADDSGNGGCAGGACHGGTKIADQNINNDDSDRDTFLSYIGSDCDIDKLIDKLSKPGHGGGERPEMVDAIPEWSKDEPTCQN